jgi:hypothetical protein
MKAFAATLVLIGGSLAVGTTLLPAQPVAAQPSSGFGGPACTVYEHAEFDGAQLPIFAGRDAAFVGPQWNDRISAVRCRPGCALIAYEHRDFQGERRLFLGRTAFVGEPWNDRISSYVSACS